MKYWLLITFFFSFQIVKANKKYTIDSVGNKVTQYNNQAEYTNAIKLLHDFVERTDISNQDRYEAYLMFGYTYKKLFDYPSSIKYFNLAKKYGQHTPDSIENVNNIACEMAIVYFDICKYDSSKIIMDKLEKDNFNGLSKTNIAYINMQQAFLYYLNKNYTESEKKYQYTLSLFQKYLPTHTSNVYVKMMQLYHRMNDNKRCDEMYQKSVQHADSVKILKYKIYAKQEYFTILTENKQYKEALALKSELDKLDAQYNKDEHLLALEKLESNYHLKLKETELKSYKRNLMIWIGLSTLLVFSIIFIIFLYRKLSLRKKEIEEQNLLNERLTSIISHDIRESLLSTNLFLKKIDKIDPYLDQIKTSIESQILHINQILENILSVKRGSPNIRNTNEIIECIEFSIKALNDKIKDKHITIITDIKSNIPILYPLNKEKFKIVLYNVLSNAIKYSYQNGKIVIDLKNNQIRVQDYGVGLNPKQKSKLLSETVLSEQGTNQESGNGMGLFFVQNIIKDTKAKIYFESPSNGGTIVNIGL